MIVMTMLSALILMGGIIVLARLAMMEMESTVQVSKLYLMYVTSCHQQLCDVARY